MTNIADDTDEASVGGSVFNGGLGVNLSVIFSLNEIKRDELLDKILHIGRLQRQIDKEKTELVAMINKFTPNG
jgi:hypothetical protein